MTQEGAHSPIDTHTTHTHTHDTLVRTMCPTPTAVHTRSPTHTRSHSHRSRSHRTSTLLEATCVSCCVCARRQRHGRVKVVKRTASQRCGVELLFEQCECE
jgi:hypothetical protein